MRSQGYFAIQQLWSGEQSLRAMSHEQGAACLHYHPSSPFCLEVAGSLVAFGIRYQLVRLFYDV